MLFQFSPVAADDLEAISDYIAEDSPANAIRFIDQMRVQCLRLLKAPMAYVARPELGEGLRSCVHGRYVIFFRPSPMVLRIERILHGARDMSAQFEPPLNE